MSIRFTTSLSLDDYMSANWLILRRYFFWSGVLKLFGFSAIAFGMIMQVISLVFDGAAGWANMPMNVLAGLCFGILMTILIPAISAAKLHILAPRRYREVATADLPINWEMDSSGYRASNAEGSADLPWDRLQDFSQDDRSIIFRRAKMVIAIIPKSQLGSHDLAGALAFLNGAGVKERR